MYATTQSTKKGFVANHWAALVVVAGTTLFACADSARSPRSWESLSSNRDVAALRAAGANADDMYINGLVLTEARALGLTEHLLLPNAATDELVAAFVNRARSEWIAQLDEAQKIQRARSDWRVDTKIPTPLLEAPPPQVR